MGFDVSITLVAGVKLSELATVEVSEINRVPLYTEFGEKTDKFMYTYEGRLIFKNGKTVVLGEYTSRWEKDTYPAFGKFAKIYHEFGYANIFFVNTELDVHTDSVIIGVEIGKRLDYPVRLQGFQQASFNEIVDGIIAAQQHLKEHFDYEGDCDIFAVPNYSY